MRRKAQGAIEYLFMIAAALVIILIVVRQLRNKGKSAGSSADLSAKQSKVEMIAQKYNSTDPNWWSNHVDDYNKCIKEGNITACNNIISEYPND
ncbi:MAG: class III signal peptide-containing protein [Thermococcus sp.]|nr:class III signal peptide-containing protein [Thermococcus sp.]